MPWEQKQLVEGRTCSSLQLSAHITEERQSRNCSKGWRILPTGSLSLLPYSSQDRQPQGGTSHCALGPPTSSIQQENCPTDSPIGLSSGDTFSVEAFSSEWLQCVSQWHKTSLHFWPWCCHLLWWKPLFSWTWGSLVHKRWGGQSHSLKKNLCFYSEHSKMRGTPER